MERAAESQKDGEREKTSANQEINGRRDKWVFVYRKSALAAIHCHAKPVKNEINSG
jgi:hypothetical protein